MKTLSVLFSLYYTWCNKLCLYNQITWAVIIMFIYLGIFVIWNPWILICYLPVSFVLTLSGGKSKSVVLKWQQYPKNEHNCYSVLWRQYWKSKNLHNLDNLENHQGVSYSQKFHGKCSFPNLANGPTSQFVSQILDRIPKCKNREIKI